MYQLTIDDTTSVTVTDHNGAGDARAALLHHAVTGDYYLRCVQTTLVRTSYELLRLNEDFEPGHGPCEPRVAGTATIEELASRDDTSRPYPAALDVLPRNVTTSNDRPPTRAAIAAAVRPHLRAGASARETATPIGYYALILWGAIA